MNFINSFSQLQIAAIILQLVILPFLVMKLSLFWWAKQSLQWPKVKGVVVKPLYFPLSKIIGFLYTYEISGTTYHNEKPFFANSFKNFSQKKASILMNNYKEGKQVTVYYNPSDHSIATLEPGWMDGVPNTLALLFLLLALKFICYNNAYILVELSNYIS